MSMPEERSRGDLAALRIHREEEKNAARPWGRIIGWTIALIVIAVLGYFGYQQFVVPQRAPAVETMTVKPTVNLANPALLTATGYLVANKTAKITPKISGKVVQLNIDTGQDVRRGDVLAVLESTNLRAQLDEADASFGNAERDYNRQLSMWREGVTTKAQLDAAEAQLKAARARVQQVRINMQDMVIRAPFDGTIAAKNTEVGEVISSVMVGQVAGTLPSGAICTLVDLKTIEVEADVNEQNISQLKEGQPAEVTVDAFPGRKWNGRLRQIVPTADRAKAVVKVKVAILDPDARLLPEMSASVSFLQTARTSQELSEPARIWLPPAAVVDKRVAVIDATNHVAWKNVTTGQVREGRIEIVGGLREGDRIVTDKAEQLKDGQLVKVSS
ncbi:MAG TPA: efflux RND transporter periplasmic adaptor subunit [Thermoanaerobaculia bacterium]|jgi:RND family efflux transporter MFP subunit|nr:efflux RND transporter periplasmic adaptor subunit [Thermoanaerobaculia bacterium]